MRGHDVDQEPKDGGVSTSERPTIPVPAPRASGVRLRIERVAWPAATVDAVMCDLSRDPRSEDFAPERAANVSVLRRRGRRARRLASAS